MKLIIGLTAILLPLRHLNAQSIKPLSVGDALPNVSLAPILNYSQHGISIPQLKDKLVILDFLTTGCVACIRALPGLDSLQTAFKGKVQVILITPEPKERVSAFLKRKKIAGIALPVLAADSVLNKLFPFTYTPHDVIINNGRVIAITYPEYITQRNIQSLIEGKKVAMVAKRDVAAFQYDKPLLLINEAVIPDFSFPSQKLYSIVSTHMNNIPRRLTIAIDTPTGMRRVTIINMPILDMYIRTLYGDELRPSFISLDVVDTGRYVYKKENGYLHDWRVKNTYCYEAAFPVSYTAADIKRKISADLDFYFSLHGSIEKRNVQCFVISKDSAAPHNRPHETFIEGEIPRPVSIGSIVFYLNGNFGDTPAIDESGEGELTIHGLNKTDYTNIPVLKEKLKEYGLQLVTAYRPVDMLVITESAQTNLSLQNQ